MKSGATPQARTHSRRRHSKHLRDPVAERQRAVARRKTADPFASTPVATTPRETGPARNTHGHGASSRTPDPLASTPVAETPRETRDQSGTSTVMARRNQRAHRVAASGTSTRSGAEHQRRSSPELQIRFIPPVSSRANGVEPLNALLRPVERVSLDQWVHCDPQDDDGIDKGTSSSTPAGERWLFKPATAKRHEGRARSLEFARGALAPCARSRLPGAGSGPEYALRMQLI